MEFFCTKSDLDAVFGEISKQHSLRFTLVGNFEEVLPLQMGWGELLQGLGDANAPSTIRSKSYLVSSNELKVRPRTIHRTDGRVVYAYDQLLNPETAVLTAGGLWNGTCLVAGRWTTVSRRKSERGVYTLIARSFRKECRVGQPYLVGPGAIVLSQTGTRLTYDAESAWSYTPLL